MNRRIFINKTVFPAIIASMGGANITNLWAEERKHEKRIRLAESGPMIPPCTGHFINGKWKTERPKGNIRCLDLYP